jgi:hypothetical protein
MLIYKDGKVADYKEFFKDTSFPASGPTDSFLEENGALKVNTWLPYDQKTQKLVSVEPYVMDGWAYTVVVEDKTPEEIEQELIAYDAQQKNNRAAAYTSEADPIFFKWQRGEATEQEWLDKVAEIKARYAYLNEETV